LRACNDLLRRLSRTEDAAFCGRISIFFFNIFPLGDRASSNRLGEFHVDNTTAFDETAKPDDDDVELMDVDGAEAHQPAESSNASLEKSVNSPKIEPSQASLDPMKPISSLNELYPVFWSLQQDFSNPPRLFHEDNFANFKRGIEATLNKFRSAPKVISTSREVSQDEEEEEINTWFNAKYLTSPDLFKLEVRCSANGKGALADSC
jgi:THO complex subunit 1